MADRSYRRPGARRAGGGFGDPVGPEVLAVDRPRSGKEELLHVLEQELLGFGLSKVESVVVDELLLHLQPFGPAGRTDLLIGTTAYIVLKGLERHALSVLAAAAAVYECHGGKIGTSGNVIQSTGRAGTKGYDQGASRLGM